jgi:predicted acylesterase/phospholipase RssA/MinD-like ATPase involved in chromosome partitioning or flagellar assembly
VDGRIYTFYSYKGGVGRSMALANVAEYFYLRGLRVLIIDWDLEAPGLENFFFDDQSDGLEQVRSRLGLLDLLTEYKRGFKDVVIANPATNATDERESDGDTESRPMPTFAERLDSILKVTQFLHQLHGAWKTDAGESGGLWLLPAGWRQGDRFAAYAQTVQSFDWSDFYQSYRGKEFFDWFALQLKAAADVILIDSRTGVTEMGGVCARHLADVVVSFCAPNSQNIYGVDRMVNSFDREDVKAERNRRPLDSLVVPTRVESNEFEKLNRFVKRFEEVIDSAERRPAIFRENQTSFLELLIPYVPAYAFGDRRVFGPEGDALTEDPRRQLEGAYAKLATHLALLAPDAHPLRQKMAAELRAAFPQLLPAVVLTYAKTDGRLVAASVRGQLESARVSMWPDLVDRSGETLEFETTLRQARFLVIIGSQETFSSPAVRAEARLARQLGKVICVVQPPMAIGAPDWLLPPVLFFESDTNGLKALMLTIQNPPPVLRAPNLAPVLEHYVERPEEAESLKRLLLAASTTTSVSTVGLSGMGGIGKTTLAAAVCQDPEIERAFPGGIVWINIAKTNETPLAAQVSAALTGEPSTLPDVLRRRLGSTSILFVIDDYTDGTAIAELSALAERCTILLIARDFTSAQAAGARVCTISPMTEVQAAALVETGQVLSAKALADEAWVIENVDRWPLALSLVRGMVQKRLDLGETAETAWAYVREMFARHGVTAFDRRDATSLSLRAALQSAFRKLDSRPDDEKVLLRLAQIRGSERIGLIEATLAAYGTSEMSATSLLEMTLSRLAAQGLLKYDGVQAQIHPLIYRFLIDEGRIEAEADQSKKKRVFSSSKDKPSNPDVIAAREILAGRGASIEELVPIIKRLKAARYFDYARRLLIRVRTSAMYGTTSATQKLWFGQQLALCTYKDGNLLPEHRFTRALEILHETDDLTATNRQETLGLAGAIYKYRWMHTGNRDHLERSLSYYQRGAAVGIASDDGYTAINAAYLLDLIASQEEAAGTRKDLPDGAVSSVPMSVLDRRKKAASMRQDIVNTLTPRAADTGSWWILVTLAEASFALGTTPEGDVDQSRYDEARYWFREALALQRDDWEYETTARQLASIAGIHGRMRIAAGKGGQDPEWQCLQVFVGNRVAALRSLLLGKVGLALSGGGFRASLFHIGILARLAEADLLRHVEVLSCVSGGSIIGAHYYLELRKLLESKADDQITREDYIEVVRGLERDFLPAVQRNLRTRVAANPLASARMVIDSHYSRTQRIGELYEKEIYSKVSDGRKGPRYMDEMLIVPHGEDRDSFAPKLDNWTRAAKVPDLILNATTVNTGHNWQFTASWMGEPAAGITESIDGNDRLRRMYYWEAPPRYKKVRLGHAVAASSCVPGLFEPLSMPGLYPEHVVELIDGGVHDNQGLAALVEQDCKIVLVSDASGQMANEAEPNVGILKIYQRSNDMLMARVRESQFRELIGRREAAALSDFVFVHLKKDLQTEPVDWVGCEDPFDPGDDSGPAARRGPLTEYGIPKSVQEQLAAIRTDLDSFTDLEAFALMYSGYRMIDVEMKDTNRLLVSTGGESVPWRFMAIEAALGKRRSEDLSRRLSDNLRVSQYSAWKVLRPTVNKVKLAAILLTLMLAVLAVLTMKEMQRNDEFYKEHAKEFGPYLAPTTLGADLRYVAVDLARSAIISFRWISWAVAGAIVVAVIITLLRRLTGTRKSMSQAVLVALLTLAAPIAWLHLAVFDRWYLRWGRLPESADRVVRR